MRILELTNFSAGICGVWARVKQESVELSKKGHEILILSSNATKGSDQIALPEENMEKVKIKRFPFTKLGGESFMEWNFEDEAFKFKPDLIIAHVYRQLHTTKSLKIAKKLNARIFLVTHAPFIEGNLTRSFFAKIAVNFYDKFVGPLTLKKFDKILAITKWEIPFLLKLGVTKEKLEYVPNGIPKEFFTQKKLKEESKILFLGRISPIKSIETLIIAMKYVENKSIILEIVGPAESIYLEKLKKIIQENNLQERVQFFGPIYDLKKKIEKIDSAKIFVLPSKREAMPQGLIEAMAREKVVISTNNPGSKELIEDKKTGFLFETGNSEDLAEKINSIFSTDTTLLKKNTRKSVEKFEWSELIKKLEKLF